MALIGRVPASPPILRAGVIGEARRRHRRRQLLQVTASLVVVATVLLVQTHGRGPADRPGGPATGGDLASLPAFKPAGAVLSQQPYLGVSCPAPNSIACDRVGLAVNLRRRAVSVSATIDGWPVRLDHRGDLPASPGRKRTEFDGFLQPAGIVRHLHVTPDGPAQWYGDSAPAPIVIRLRIDYGGRNEVVTHTTIPLSTGWG